VRSSGWRLLACKFAAATVLVGFSQATQAEDALAKARRFDELKAPGECGMLALNTMLITEARDQGMTKNRAYEVNQSNKGPYPVPTRVIDSVFDNSKLRKDLLMSYWSWECRARAYGIPIAALETVEAELRRCPEQGAARENYLRRIRNELLGLPRDFVPESPSPPPVPPARSTP
jgi:hypothetical protein